ncbi:MAG: twin-arginine translocation signal domain-containing protein [Desulfobulbaceae bacterium]|nr:twin-arginine translocation signal domain-containing protein [Desulfobulbaceae bacterium]
MNKRREFLKGTAVAAGILTIGKVEKVFASSNMYTNIIYTKENPGQFAKKAPSHAPKVVATGNKIDVVTEHGMSEKHFIVRHTLVLADGTVVGAKTFTPNDKRAESSYELPEGYKGAVYATSFCNLHDFWLTEIHV